MVRMIFCKSFFFFLFFLKQVQGGIGTSHKTSWMQVVATGCGSALQAWDCAVVQESRHHA